MSSNFIHPLMIEIFSKEGCELCDEAARLCEREGIEFKKLTIGRDELEKKVGGRFDAFPQIFLGERRIGNFFNLEEWVETEYEPLLHPTENRYTVFPLRYPKLWEMYKKAQHSNWSAEEIDFSRDPSDWKTLSEQEQRFLKLVLAFFAGSDGVVLENCMSNFGEEVQVPEARCFYAFQMFNEAVHGETYSLLIDTLVDDEREKNELFSAMSRVPCIEEKARWAMKWFDATSKSFGERLFAFACVEGIFFSGAFAAIFWMKKRALLPGLCFSNELISRDEGLHTEFAVELFGMLRHKPSHVTLRAIVGEAVAIEKRFITESLPCALIGMNAEKMCAYIEYVADRLLKMVNVAPIFNSKNPFDWMENISMEGKTNFFEKRVGEYSKMADRVEETIAFDANF